MSLSTRAVQADGFYQPPDFDPKKHGTLNKIHGTHRLGKRRRRDGTLQIRFEMPFKTWCLGCQCIVAKGVRFTAQKKKTEMYLDKIPVYEFSMKCYHCETIFVIKTDPETTEYICVSGIRRKVEDRPLTRPDKAPDEDEPNSEERAPRFRDEEDVLREDGLMKLRGHEEQLELELDPLLRLEVREQDRKRAQGLLETNRQLEEVQMTRCEDFKLNQKARGLLRQQKKEVIKEVSSLNPEDELELESVRKRLKKGPDGHRKNEKFEILPSGKRVSLNHPLLSGKRTLSIFGR